MPPDSHDEASVLNLCPEIPHLVQRPDEAKTIQVLGIAKSSMTGLKLKNFPSEDEHSVKDALVPIAKLSSLQPWKDEA